MRWRAAPSCRSWTRRSGPPRPGQTAVLLLWNKRHNIHFPDAFHSAAFHNVHLPLNHRGNHTLLETLQRSYKVIDFCRCSRTQTNTPGGPSVTSCSLTTSCISVNYVHPVGLTCSESRLFDLVRHLGVELFILLQLRPHPPPATTSLIPAPAPTSPGLAASTPTLPLNQVSDSPLGHRCGLGDVLLYCGHQTFMSRGETDASWLCGLDKWLPGVKDEILSRRGEKPPAGELQRKHRGPDCGRKIV